MISRPAGVLPIAECPTSNPERRAPYLFSGVRSSSGAETGGPQTAASNSGALHHSEVAATEDGRAPLNSFPKYYAWFRAHPMAWTFRMVRLMMLSPILPKSPDAIVCTLVAQASGF